MMPQTDRSAKLHGGLPPETDIHIPPASTEDQVLSRLNKNYRLSKAQQILRLLKDQDALNQRFRECDLLDEDEDNAKNKEKSQQDAENEDAWSLQEEQQSDAGDSDLSENEADRRAAKIVSLRKHRNSVDPGRCKTSMGFYNQAEVTEIPYDTDSDNVAGLDSAGSTPRGDAAAGATTTTLQPTATKQTLYGQGTPNPCGNSSRTKISHPNKGNNSEVTVKELTISEADRLVQSARSSRPKTSLTSSSSTRSRYYRQQPHPECQHNLKAHHGNQQPHHPVELHHRFPQPHGGGMPGDTRQSIISRLEPHHPMAVKPFCETRASQEEASRAAGVQAASQTSTSKNNLRHQQQSGNNNNAPHHFSPATAAAVALYDMAPVFSKDAPVRSVTRRGVTGPTAGSSHHHGTNPNRSTSFLEHQRMLPGRAPRLSVDSSPLQLGEVSPRGRGVVLNDDPANRRGAPRLTRVKKRVGEMSRGSVPSPMHVLTERAHPSVTVMKLPPLETAVSKGGGAAGRDLVCVGKD